MTSQQTRKTRKPTCSTRRCEQTKIRVYSLEEHGEIDADKPVAPAPVEYSSTFGVSFVPEN